MAVTVTAIGETFARGASTPLFDMNFTLLDRTSRGTQYAVLKNGHQFLINRTSDEAVPITVTANWAATPQAVR